MGRNGAMRAWKIKDDQTQEKRAPPRSRELHFELCKLPVLRLCPREAKGTDSRRETGLCLDCAFVTDIKLGRRQKLAVLRYIVQHVLNSSQWLL